MAMISSSAWVFPPRRFKLCVRIGSRRIRDLRNRASSEEFEAPDLPKARNSEEETSAGQSPGVSPADGETSDKVKLALQRAREYKKKKGNVGNQAGSSDGIVNAGASAPESAGISSQSVAEFEETKDAIAKAISKGGEYELGKRIVESGGAQGPKAVPEKTTQGKPKALKVSSIDFLGFDFSDKKRDRGISAGWAPTVETSFGEDLPEVEFIVGDRSKFGPATSKTSELDSDMSDENSALYKPKVSTWGVFARPKDISKTFGGGKTIRPGDVLETDETKAVKEEYTRKMIAKYQNEIGLVIDPKVKAECEKALKEGNLLMDAGRLREALPYYENVMASVVFKNELHGLAALQWSICQDSLGRTNEARVMYEKLQSHPNIQVNKKAKQFMFGFQAMEIMKVGSSVSSSTTGYETYFDAFLPEDLRTNPTVAEEGDSVMFWQAVPYLLLLIFPLFIVLAAALRKSL
ncbi:cytochrome C oxidase subunit [Wolffia australiana]